MMSMGLRTVFAVLEETAARWGKNHALHQPVPGRRRKYRTLNWIEYRQAVAEIACGLRSLGIRKGDVVALDSETRAEFYLADQGVMANGSIAAALYSTYPASGKAAAIRASGARAVIAGNPALLEPVRDASAGSPPYWILLEGEAAGAMSLDALRAAGRDAQRKDPALFQHIQTEYGPDDPAILYMTSGATGEPKMALTSHRAIVANLDMGHQVLDIGPDDVTIAFLPSAHIAQRIVVELLPMRMGSPVWFSENLNRLPAELRELRPTWFLAPPRVWERVYSTICTEIRKRPLPVRRLFHGALGLGIEAARLRQSGKRPPGWMDRSLKVADYLVFRKIRHRFGGRLRMAASGAAPLGHNLAQFYAAIGMTLIEGYGLTEGGIVTFNRPDRPRAGSIGTVLPGVEVRLAPDGELLVKSPCIFEGYLDDPQTTAEVLRDGWLHTGDLAEIDAEGFIYITGRKKDLIVSSNGKKIYPSRIECLLKSEPLINQVVLIGDRMPYVTALLTLNPAAVASLHGLVHVSEEAMASLATSREVQKELREALRRVNAHLAPFEQIRKYRVIGRELSIEHGELTPTMKVRRQKAIENFRPLIQEMYAGREEMI